MRTKYDPLLFEVHEDGNFFIYGLPISSQISFRRERMNSYYFGNILSIPPVFSSSSLEKQDHLSDS
jgi:hypothetical protein